VHRWDIFDADRNPIWMSAEYAKMFPDTFPNIGLLNADLPYTGTELKSGEIRQIAFMSIDESVLPINPTIAITIDKKIIYIDLELDPEFTTMEYIYTIDEWITIEGQRFYFKKFDVYPTITTLYIESDPNNTQLLRYLDIVLTDNKGNIWEYGKDGIGYSIDENENINRLYFESCYFDEPESLTFIINKIGLAKIETIEIDAEAGIITGVPDHMIFESMSLEEDDLILWFTTAMYSKNAYFAVSDETGKKGKYGCYFFGIYDENYKGPVNVDNGNLKIVIMDYDSPIKLEMGWTPSIDIEPINIIAK